MTRTSRKQLVLAEKMTSGRLLIEQETHVGLWLDRYIQSPDRDEIESRDKLFKEVVEIPLSEAYRVFYANWEATLKEYSVEEPHYAKAKGRLIVGMGDESIVETLIALHHTYGVPYLPGSALKGLAASYAHQQLQGEWKKGGEWHKIVFGNTEEAGFITFFDALYVPSADREKEEAILYRDVITVHHPEYYRDKKENAAPAADWDSPTPITFLSTGGTYLLALAAPDLEEKETWLQATFQVLEMALANVGIGGKTSSGYGRMVVSPSAFVTEAASSEEKIVPTAPDPERSVVKSLCNEIEQFKPHSVAGQGRNIYNTWLKLQGQEGRVLVALTMIEKIGKLNQEKTALTRDWYQAMKSFLEQAIQEE